MAYRTYVMLCAGTACVSNHSFVLKEVLEKEIKKCNLENEVAVVMTGCYGVCAKGPLMVIKPDGIFYHSLKTEDIPYLVEEHLLKGRPVKKLMYIPPEEKTPVPLVKDIRFFNQQMLIALRNRGLIDPENIDEYIARDGYKALAKVLFQMTPERVIKEIKDSGLRGRGGAGFPTGRKWESCRAAKGEPKYIICNADEGDPGAFMDRSIIEADPHAVIEGMIIAGYAVGAEKGYVYVRVEYPLAIERMTKAINQATEYGLLGKNILGSKFNFEIEIFKGAGAFVCGESTTLMKSIEGKPAEPRQTPPRSVEKGLWGKPTTLNNVETFANVPSIINRGAEWFSSIGTATSKGTKVFSLAGKINNAGLVEVPMGITLREIVFDIGGGIPNGKQFLAVQIGGPSGGFIPEHLMDLPVDYESLVDAGAMMGSGGMVVLDENDCVVDVARYFMDFLKDESCGKCTSCREGTQAMYDILIDICEGRGNQTDIELLQELGETIIKTSMCGLGTSAANPVLSTLRYFKDVYMSHIRDKKCPAGVCKELIQYYINKEKCTGCTLCAKNCPSEAIAGQVKQPHAIDISKCIKCGACYEVCKFDAVVIKQAEIGSLRPRESCLVSSR